MPSSCSARVWSVGLRGPVHRARRLVVGEGVVARHARVALLEAAQGFVDLGGRAQAAPGDAGLQLGQIAQEPLLVLVADGAIFLDAAVAATEDLDLVVPRPRA